MAVNEEYPLHEMVDFASVVVETTAFENVLSSLIEAFELPRFLAGIGIEAEADAMRRLESKVAAHLLDQLTTDRVDAPYVSVWEKGRHQEVRMVYINPAIEKITGFSARKVLKIGSIVRGKFRSTGRCPSNRNARNASRRPCGGAGSASTRF